MYACNTGYASLPGASACGSCLTGSYPAGLCPDTQTSCPQDTYGVSWLTKPTCAVCPSGKFSMPGSTNCSSMSYVLAGSPKRPGSASSSHLYTPQGLSVDKTGNVYIANTGTNQILILSARSGKLSRFAGVEGYMGGFSGDGYSVNSDYVFLNSPGGVATDYKGNVYIADTNNHVIRRVDVKTNIIMTYAGMSYFYFEGSSFGNGLDGGGLEATSAQLSYPHGVAIDSSNNVYIADTGNHCIRKVSHIEVSETNIITTVAGTGIGGDGLNGLAATATQLNSPYAVAVDVSGNLYIADSGNNRVRVVQSSTQLMLIIAGNGGTAYSPGVNSYPKLVGINSPRSIAVDRSGNVYVADTGNSVLWVLKPRAGAINSTISNAMGVGYNAFNGVEGPATSLALRGPSGVAVDYWGNVYVSDSDNQVVRMIAGELW
jgi:trimeric autotransporter adhesin